MQIKYAQKQTARSYNKTFTIETCIQSLSFIFMVKFLKEEH